MSKYISKKDLVIRWNCHGTLLDYYSNRGILRRKKVKNKVGYLIEDVIKHEATWNKKPSNRRPKSMWNKIITWLKKVKIL